MESPSPLSRYIPQNSKKRVFPGGSSTCMEAEVVEISPPGGSWGSKARKRKEVNFPEIIDVDLDEDGGDVVLIGEKVVPMGKGKEVMDNIFSDPGDRMKKGSVHDALMQKTCTPGTANIINNDGFSSTSFYGDDKYGGDDYAIFLQSHFDNLDIPTGIEAPIPWLFDLSANKMKSFTPNPSNKRFSKRKLDNVGVASSSDSFLSPWPLETAQMMSTPGSSSTSGTPLSSLGQTQSSTWSFVEPIQGTSNVTAASGFTLLNSQFKDPLNLSTGKKLPKPLHYHSSLHLEKKPFSVGAMSYITSEKEFPVGLSYISTSSKQRGDDNSWSNMATPVTDWQGILDVAGQAIGTSSVFQGYNGPSSTIHVPPKDTAFSPLFYDPVLAPSVAVTSEIASVSSSTKVEYGNPDEVIKRLQPFKKFDTVEDFSDHYYYKHDSVVKQPSKSWSKKIQDEWRILEKDLPDTIFVRVYESRMDLLRAVIMGAAGTPYHDGLFFFDVFFPSNYPSVPPKVHYHSGGLRINPNLYNCGKVCLSLLNTWSGSQKEKWLPRTSTMLQVLVSIQGLILNAKPYFNEPGYASMSGSLSGEQSSLQYNERTFILSLKTMIYNIRRPPKHFEDYVVGHFCNRAHDILVACQAYIDGAQVGCLAKGGVQDVDEGDKSCSQEFRRDVASSVKMLVDAFKQVGAKDCEKFLLLAQKSQSARPVPR